MTQRRGAITSRSWAQNSLMRNCSKRIESLSTMHGWPGRTVAGTLSSPVDPSALQGSSSVQSWWAFEKGGETGFISISGGGISSSGGRCQDEKLSSNRDRTNHIKQNKRS
jgi:hypothetical protein